MRSAISCWSFTPGVHAPDESDFRARTVERLSRLIGFDCAVWGGGQAEDRQVTDLAIVEHDPALLMKWQDVADQDGSCDLALRRMGQACTFDDVDGFRSSLAYHEHWRAFGVNQMMSVIAAEPIDGDVSFLGLCREEAPRRFAEHSRALMRQRGVSRTTTAFHLRNLFAKTGTGRQPELVRVLLAHAVAASPSRD